MASSAINAMYDRFSSYIKDLGDRTVLNDRDDIEGTST